MSFRSWQAPLRGLAAAALTVLVSGCADGVLSPSAPASPADPASVTAFEGRAGTHASRHLRYRDRGAKPWTGRSGSASLSAMALRGADGVVHLVATTGDLEAPGAAPGSIAKLQVKGLGPDQAHLFTRNHNRLSGGGTVELEVPGLPAGSALRLQANVRGIDGRRTDVVTVEVPVVAGPGLALAVDVPAEVVPGVPFNVTAVVSETGGATGALARCVLYVDGVAADTIEDVWVDAGDAVSCAFTATVDAPGEHRMVVRVEDVRPAGVASFADVPSLSAGGEAAALVRVSPPRPSLSWTASVHDRTVSSISRFDYNWSMPNGSHKEYESTDGEARRAQTLSVYATLSRAVSLPVAAVEVGVESGGADWHTESFSAPAFSDGADGTCWSQSVTEQGSMLSLCTTGSGAEGSTVFSYTRFAGTVTYLSNGFYRRWDAPTATEVQNFVWNDDYTVRDGSRPGGQIKPLGSSVSIRFSVSDALAPFGATAVVPLSSYQETLGSTPYTCLGEALWWLEGGIQTECRSSQTLASGWKGEATGSL